MAIIMWIVLGLIVGALAKLIMPGEDGGGFVMTALLGIGGALLGGFLASSIGLTTVTNIGLSGLVVSVLGALLLLGGYRMLQGRAT